MRTVFILAIMALVASGFYNYFVRNPLKHTTIEKDAVAVDMGEYTVKFSAVKEFRETYMLFGGEYYNDKKLINPIWLSGLGIADAKNIYARYPDFYSCKSPGASLAQPMVIDLDLIPADTRILDELRESIKEYEENFANKGDRVCVALYGKTLEMQSAEVHGQNIDIKDKLQPRTYRLINSSQRINCKNILD